MIDIYSYIIFVVVNIDFKQELGLVCSINNKIMLLTFREANQSDFCLFFKSFFPFIYFNKTILYIISL